jgi:F-type H+-transporting ATPase subunit delta
VISRRYARALLALSLKEGASLSVKKEMISVGNLMKQKKYFDFFTDRLVHAGEKIEVLRSFSPLTRDFLRLVIANKREEYLSIISKEYVELLNSRNNVIDGVVSSKAPLSAEQKSRLVDKLEKQLAKKVNLSFRTDSKIIGGLRIRYGTKVIDGTVSGMLNGMLERLTGR